MNELNAKIIECQSSDSLHRFLLETIVGKIAFVTLEVKDLDISKIGFKESVVGIAKSGEFSFSNQIKIEISAIKKGEILSLVSGVKNGFTINSMITTASLTRLGLEVGQEVIFLIKATDIFII
ncbi:TOBE domain-containing protein [Campylobacter sputorum]|uniref:TOBE domain-containing protein n=1 Tax=Campylobacter sputorum TaxID=206 RepID=UPI00053BF1F2|nr:TOBE domain-containing protein [Campylobacter sputorum]